MGYRAALLSFSKGEVSPEIEARFDLDAYQVGCRRALNVTVRRAGGLAKRMGTRFVAEAMGDTERLLAFQFSDDQGYALEFAQAKMRPLANGGAILEEGLAVTNITKAAQAVVTARYHGYSVGDPVYFADITGMVEINDRFLTVASVIDQHSFTINHDTTGYGTFTGSGGGTTRTAAPSAPVPPTVPAPLPPPPPPEWTIGGHGGYFLGKWRGWGDF